MADENTSTGELAVVTVAAGPPVWWQALAGPARLLAYGLVVLLLLGLLNHFVLGGMGGAGGIGAALGGSGGLRTFAVAALIFGVGLAFAAYLWWLSARYFSAIRDMPADKLAALKDLPMALPEGTVRAVIALIVGVVGLPILVFSRALDLNESIAGYINGIVTGVFAYYFGTRSATADAQTARASVKLADAARSEADQLRAQAGALGQVVAQATSAADQATADKEALARGGRFALELDRLQRHAKAASSLIGLLDGTLPGLLPAGARDALDKANSVLGAAQAISGGVDENTLHEVAAAARELLGKSPLPGLIEKAAGALPLVGTLGPAAGVLMVLGLGWQLGSEQYQRWVARVLDAPYNPQLIDPGYLTAASAGLCLERAPIFARAFAEEIRSQPQFAGELLDLALREDASDRLWQRWGGDGRFASRGEATDGLMEFRGLLLGERGRADIDTSQIGSVAARLPASLAGAAQPTPDEVNAVFDARLGNAPGSAEQRGAFEALVLLTGELRAARIDPLPLIGEVLP
ncbi:hypothetical protein [Derxia lacustris]|uniref:hypothetical protein n=1 Tax=Derxia lacustris TaxID=764842 RepID=UPI000A16F955|nr:hypothetical protein [Derxia lacustris]